MNDSPFSRAGARLSDMGYSVLPILPNAKRPGQMSRGRWFGETDWSRFCTRKPTDIEIELWSKWPEAGIGVCMGPASGNLAAIDVDTDNSAVQRAIESVIEPSPVQKTGRTGFTAFYRANPIVESTSFNIVGERALDLLCSGRQTVLPPSLHPEAGRPYIWQTMATLEDTSADRLPLLPDDIADRLGSVLAPFGFLAPVERPHADSDGGIWREVNEVALQRLSDWVPHLGIDAKRNGNGNWRGVALWRGGDGHNVSFSEQGIRDFAAGTGMTALDTVMSANTCDFATAEKWLRQRLGFKEPPPVVFRSRPAQPPAAAAPVAEPAVYAPRAKVDPYDPKEAGGLLEATASWIYAISIRPSRELAMLAAIGIMAAFAGRRYVGPTGLTTNMYLCGIASTGVGKDAPLSAAKSLFTTCQGKILNMLGSGDLSSDAVIEKLMRQRPSNLSTIDEVGAWLQESSGRNAPAYARARRKSLLELYSLSRDGQIWLGKDRAGAETLASSEPLYSPSMSILGMSTEELFFKGLTEENLRDGLVARLTVVHVGRGGKRQRISGSARPPATLIGMYQDALTNWPKAGGLTNTNMSNPTIPPAMHLVPWASDEVRDAYEKFDDWQWDTIEENHQAQAYMSRASEQAMKIAMVRAVSRDAKEPSITAQDWDFGQSFVCRSIDMMEIAIKRYMAGSDFEELYKKALEYCRQESGKGLKPSDLWRKPGMSKIEPKRREEAVRFLSTQGMWEVRATGKKGVRYFYVEGGVVEEE